MGGLDFVSSLAGAVAWPSAVVICVLALRRELGGLFPRLESLEIAGGKAVFGGLSRIEGAVAAVTEESVDHAVEHPVPAAPEWDRIMELASSSPKAAVIEAWAQLEYRLNVASDQIDSTGAHGWPQVGRNFGSWSQWPLLRPSVQELHHLAELTSRSAKPPTSVDAARYVSVARDLAAALQQMTL